MLPTLHAPLDRLLDPFAKCLTVEVARQFVELRADPETQSRIDELAGKANEGTLSPAERAEYEGYVEAIKSTPTAMSPAPAARKSASSTSPKPTPPGNADGGAVSGEIWVEGLIMALRED